jgi:hypothetical protein
VDPAQLELHLLAQLQVERAEGLVEQKHLRTGRQCSSEANATRLATGQLAWSSGLETLELYQSEQLVDSVGRLGSIPSLSLEAVGDVLEHGHMRKQGTVLEDEVGWSSIRLRIRDIYPVDPHDAAVRPLEPDDDAQQGGLPAAARPEDRNEAAATDVGDTSSTRARCRMTG